jgi:hypothetical protein
MGFGLVLHHALRARERALFMYLVSSTSKRITQEAVVIEIYN